MSSIINQTADSFELKNVQTDQKQTNPPTLLAEVGIWRSTEGNQSGVSVALYGDIAPLLSASDTRKFAKWLLRAADELEGAMNRSAERKGQKKRREFEEDE